MNLDNIIGIVLLFINIPFGLGGFIYFIYVGRKYRNKIYYYFAFLTYVASWFMLFAGIYLCGEKYSKYIIETYVIKYTYIIVLLVAAVFVFFYLFRKKIFKNLLKKIIIRKPKKNRLFLV